MPSVSQEHLIKRSPSFTQTGVLSTSKGIQHFTESALNKRPAGGEARAGHKVWVAETGYGIYAEGCLVEDPLPLEFHSISDLLDRQDEIPITDDPFIMSLIRKLHGSSASSRLHMLVVKTEISDIGSFIPVPKELRTQASWL